MYFPDPDPEWDQDLIFPFDQDEVFPGFPINNSTKFPTSQTAQSLSGIDTNSPSPVARNSIRRDVSIGLPRPSANKLDIRTPTVQRLAALSSTANTATPPIKPSFNSILPSPQSSQHPTTSADMASEGFETFASGNEDIVTTVHFNFYGTRQVLGSSDKTIKVYDEKNEVWTLIDSWRAHDAMVSDAKWSAPFWGEIIGSVGEDMKFKVWQENFDELPKSGRRFSCIYAHAADRVPYVSLDFKCKHQPSTETYVALITRGGCLQIYKPVHSDVFTAWQSVDTFQVCTQPPRSEETAFKVCFNSDKLPNFHVSMAGLSKESISLVVSAMNEAKIYRTDNNNTYWLAATLSGHQDLVRDVAWAPGGSFRGFDTIATASKDGRIRVFQIDTPLDRPDYHKMPATTSAATNSKVSQNVSQNNPSMIGAGLAGATSATGASRVGTGISGRISQKVTMVAELASHGGEVWRVKFDRMGNLLASAGDDGTIRLWKKAINGQWMEYSEISVEEAAKKHGLRGIKMPTSAGS